MGRLCCWGCSGLEFQKLIDEKRKVGGRRCYSTRPCISRIILTPQLGWTIMAVSSPWIPVKTFIIAPIDLIKTQMQVQCIGKRMNSDYMGWRGTVRHIYLHAGVSGFTCGFMTCLGRFSDLLWRHLLWLIIHQWPTSWKLQKSAIFHLLGLISIHMNYWLVKLIFWTQRAQEWFHFFLGA